MKEAKNPMSMYAPALVSAAVLYIFAFVLKLNTTQVVVGAIATVLVLFGVIFLWDAAYPRWFARKINPYMVSYQENRDLYAYLEGIAPWEKYAISRVCKNALMVNKTSVLYEGNHLRECLELLCEYEKKMKTAEEKRYIFASKILCLEKMNDTQQKEEVERQLQSLNEKYGETPDAKDGASPTTAHQSKRAALNWLLAALVCFLLMVAVVLLELYSGLIVLFLFFGAINLLIALAWLIRWLILLAKAHRG